MSNRNAADLREVKDMERLEMRRGQRFEDSLKAVMSTPAGRQYVWLLIRDAGVFETPFSTHGGQQSYNIGKGDFGRKILADALRLCPDEYLVMEREAREVEKLELAQIEAARTRRGRRAGEDGDDESVTQTEE